MPVLNKAYTSIVPKRTNRVYAAVMDKLNRT